MNILFFRKGLINIFLIVLFSSIFASCNESTSTESELPQPHYLSSLEDIDGNIYKTIKIGDQWWMAENLAVTTYKNGTPVLRINDSQDWQFGSAGYCIFENNNLAPGLLYNYAAVSNSEGLAPEGWHIADDEDWKKLEINLGMSLSNVESVNWRLNGRIGDKLKILAPTGWTIHEDVWGNNESGFQALAGGCRLFDGTWSNPGLNSSGYWWCASKFTSEKAWFRQLDYKSAGVLRFYVPLTYGLSVRCVKD